MSLDFKTNETLIFVAKCHKILPMRQISETFRIQDIILDLDPDGKYENQISISFHNDDCAKLDGIIEGKTVAVEAWFNGRSWLKEGQPEEKRAWFNKLKGIAIAQSTKDDDMKALAEDNLGAWAASDEPLPF